MKPYILLIIFLIVWISIAIYLFAIDKKVKDLKKMIKFRENFEK